MALLATRKETSMKLGRTGNVAQIIDRPAYEFEIIAFTGEIVDSRTVADPVAALKSLGAKVSPALTRPGPLVITARDCVICGPDTDCICHTIEFGSPEYFARIDRLHGRNGADRG